VDHRADIAVFRASFSAGLFGRPGTPPPGAAVLEVGATVAELILAVDRAEPAWVAVADGHRQVVRADLDCLLLRAWLFGIVTAIERQIRTDLLAGAHWREQLSPERLEKARLIKGERARRGQAVDTFACLQFGDLGQVAVRESWWQRWFGMGSNRQAKELTRRLEVLRNDLAHGQEVVMAHWPTMVVIAANLDHLAPAGR
jgi:hypothetical protein